MIDAGINDKDLVIIKKQSHANNGDIVVALIDKEATFKRFRKKGDDTIGKQQMMTLRQEYILEIK